MPEMHKHSRLMGDTGLHIQSCRVFAYRSLQWQKHLRATWYTTLPKARGQMKAGFDGGSQTHQYIQIPLLMPSRYERHTADIWEQIYGKRERADWRPDIRVYETLFCWHKRPYWQITINRLHVINVRDWKATFRVYISHLMGFQHKKRVFTCSEVHLPQDTQLLCPECLFPSGAPVLPGVGLGGASLQPQSLYQGNTFSGPEHNTGAAHRYKREKTWCYFSLIFFFFFNSFTLNLTCRARPGSLLCWEVVINII